jgi:hypothetical protein
LRVVDQARDGEVKATAAGPQLAAACGYHVLHPGGYVDQSHLHRDVVAFAGATPAAIAVAPFLAIDDVAWPASG